MELKGGLVRRASVTYVVEPVGEGRCRVTYSTEGVMRPLMAWATPFIPAMGKRLIRGNLATLSGLLDAGVVGVHSKA
jgi:hypothetical protein